MAKPRIFISSTFYDLRQVREDLERFVNSLGYEPVRHETGDIAYGKDKPLEEAAYREVDLCDVIVCIIGGRYGTESSTRQGSITQNELKRAFEKGIQTFIFVEQSVQSEYSTYELNKGNKDVNYRFADNPKVYEFLEQLHALPMNNPIAPFSTSADICTYLQSQWAGLFQRFLQGEKRRAEMKVLEEMKAVAATLQQLVSFLTVERRSKDDAIKSILLVNHPAFRAFASATGTAYRVFFTDKEELEVWLRYRSWSPIPEQRWDEGSVMEWESSRNKQYLMLTHNIFLNDGRLKPMTEAEWKSSWLKVQEFTVEEEPEASDLPF